MSDTNRIKHVTLRFFFVCLSFDTFSLVLTKARKRKGLEKMKENNKKEWYLGMGFVGMFIIWTMLIQKVDVQPIGINGTTIGLATMNGWFHKLTGVHMAMYHITDWLGLVPIAMCVTFGGVGFLQLIKRRSLVRVDNDIIILRLYYVLVIAAYLMFEMIPMNYRPVLIEGRMEDSYPSSTTLLVLCVMPTVIEQVNRRINSENVRRSVRIFVVFFSMFMVIGRLISGVHWFTDIVGSVLLSTGMFSIYNAVVMRYNKNKDYDTD